MSKNKEDVGMLHDYQLHIPTRTIYMGSESSSDTAIEHGQESGTDHTMAERAVKNLHLLNQISAEPITIIMNNLGGDVYHGAAIYDAIKSSRSPVTIKVSGQAMSMGAVILQGAERRILQPSARLMIHYGFISISGEAKTVYRWIEEYKRDDRKMEQIFLERIKKAQPHFTLQRLRHMLTNDTILTAQQAIDLGLADEIE